VRQTLEQYCQLDILASNAGIEHFAALDEVSVQDFDHVLAVNTCGQFFAMQQAARHMRRGGRLICTSTMCASKGLARHALYAASKAAVEALARNLAVERGLTGDYRQCHCAVTDGYRYDCRESGVL